MTGDHVLYFSLTGLLCAFAVKKHLDCYNGQKKYKKDPVCIKLRLQLFIIRI